MEDKYIRLKAAEEECGIKGPTLRSWINKGHVPKEYYTKRGRPLFIHKDLLKYLKDCVSKGKEIELPIEGLGDRYCSKPPRDVKRCHNCLMWTQHGCSANRGNGNPNHKCIMYR